MKLRKLTSALVAAGALTSPWALGLGLGDITLKSALNQPLQAEIKLLQTRELAQEEILPDLAGEADFEQAGVERFFFLTDIKFDVELSGKGDGTLLLTTKQSIQEPFLNFLVEVNWPNGRVLREYTVLLDPPVYEDEVLAPVVTPVAAPAQALVDAQSQSTSKKNSQATVTPVAAPANKAQSSDSRVNNGTFGPVSSSDTLWDIALKVRPDRSVTVQQTMMSLRELNPNAFIAGNINKIKKGSVLRVPTLEQVKMWGEGSAIEEVAAHNKRYKDSITPGSASQVQLSAVDQQLQPAVVAPEEARLKIVRSDATTETAGSATGDQLSDGSDLDQAHNELAITQENLDKANRENEKLQERIKQLEEQMSKMSRLVTLKDNQMAELQMTMDGSEDAPSEMATGDMSGTEMPAAESSEMEPAETASVEALAEEAGMDAQPEMPMAEPETAEVAVPEMADAEMVEVEPAQPEEVTTPAVVPPSKPVVNVGAESAVQKSEQGLIGTILGNPVWLIAIGAGSLLFVILLFMMSRRSYQRESELSDVIDANSASESTSVPSDDQIQEIDQELDDLDLDSQGFGQVSLENDDAVEPDDIVARADSYIAYGQFDNAVSLLEEAINKESGRIDLRLKMLEVYAEMQDSQGFERQKQEIINLGAEDVMGQINVLEQKLPGSMTDASVSAFDHGESLQAGESVLDDSDFDLSGSDDSDDFSYSLEDLESELASDLSGDSMESSPALETESSDLDLSSDAEDFSLDFDVTDDAPKAASDELGSDMDVLDAELDALDSLETPEFDVGTQQVDETLDVATVDGLEDDVSLDADLETGLDSDEGLDDLSLDAPVLEESAAESSLDDLDADLDIPNLESTEAAPVADGEMDLGADLEDLAKSLGVDSVDEVDLDAELASASDAGSETVADVEETGLEDADVPTLDLDESAASTDETSDLDELSLDTPDLEESADLDSVDLDSMDLDMDSVDAPEAVAETVAETPSSEPVVSSDLDDEVKANLEEDELDFYAGTDEVATKLDLARAYVDMGDVDGARDILEEVIVEGNEDQKGEATELLKGLS